MINVSEMVIIYFGILITVLLLIDLLLYMYFIDKIDWMELNKVDKKKKKEIEL